MRLLDTRIVLVIFMGLVLTAADVWAQVPLVNDSIFRQSRDAFEQTVPLREVEVPIDGGGDGGPDGQGVTGRINENGFIVVNGSGQQALGLNFISEQRLLIPTGDGTLNADPAPFSFLLVNDQNQVAYGNLGNPVILDGDLTLGVGYRGDSPSTDLMATWGRGIEEIAFPISGGGTTLVKTPFNQRDDGSIVDYSEVIYAATIEAGSATGTPPDTPADRVDPNTAAASFKGVGSLEIVHPTLGTFICSGSVITDTNVLTAGHCFDYDNDGGVDPGIVATFYLNDGGSPSSTTSVAAVSIHPDFGGFATTGANDDLAVVTLASALPAGTTKYKLRAANMTVGEVIDMVGYGISGQGDVGGIEVLPDYNVKRSGKNTVDVLAVDDEGSGADELFVYDFDGPTGMGLLGGATLGNDLETVVRGGDSGGPAFVEVSGELVISGVNTFEFTLPPTTPPTGEFGVLGGGVIVSPAFATWVQGIAPGTVLLPEPSSIALVYLGALSLGLVRRRRRM